jgi:hypothetical protein
MNVFRRIDNALRRRAGETSRRMRIAEKQFLIELRSPAPNKPRRRLR